MPGGFGETSQKVLLLLLGGLALGFSGNPLRYRRVFKSLKKDWQEIDRRKLQRAINRLYESHLISFKTKPDGAVELELNREGRKIALRYKFDEMKIPVQKSWDKHWRVILFDIPEEKRQLRDTLRIQLRRLGLRELQKSVFVHPYECRNEIDFLIELYDARRYVRFIEALHIDNELHLKKKFSLL